MEPSPVPAKKSKLTLYIIIFLALGIAAGFVLNKTYIKEENQSLDSLSASIQSINPPYPPMELAQSPQLWEHTEMAHAT